MKIDWLIYRKTNSLRQDWYQKKCPGKSSQVFIYSLTVNGEIAASLEEKKAKALDQINWKGEWRNWGINEVFFLFGEDG